MLHLPPPHQHTYPLPIRPASRQRRSQRLRSVIVCRSLYKSLKQCLKTFPSNLRMLCQMSILFTWFNAEHTDGRHFIFIIVVIWPFSFFVSWIWGMFIIHDSLSRRQRARCTVLARCVATIRTNQLTLILRPHRIRENDDSKWVVREVMFGFSVHRSGREHIKDVMSTRQLAWGII